MRVGALMALVSGGKIESPTAAMSVSLPNLKPLKAREPGPRFIQVPESPATGGAAALIDKHSETIEQLRLRLGFEKDTTVIAWLLEQIEQSPDLSKTIADLLGCP